MDADTDGEDLTYHWSFHWSLMCMEYYNIMALEGHSACIFSSV